MPKLTDLAPEGCIVCGKQFGQHDKYVYFAGVKPIGAMACELECAPIVLRRILLTGNAGDSKHDTSRSSKVGLE